MPHLLISSNFPHLLISSCSSSLIISQPNVAFTWHQAVYAECMALQWESFDWPTGLDSAYLWPPVLISSLIDWCSLLSLTIGLGCEFPGCPLLVALRRFIALSFLPEVVCPTTGLRAPCTCWCIFKQLVSCEWAPPTTSTQGLNTVATYSILLILTCALFNLLSYNIVIANHMC